MHCSDYCTSKNTFNSFEKVVTGKVHPPLHTHTLLLLPVVTFFARKLGPHETLFYAEVAFRLMEKEMHSWQWGERILATQWTVVSENDH